MSVGLEVHGALDFGFESLYITNAVIGTAGPTGSGVPFVCQDIIT
jgi:hypothetical protein